MKFSLCFLAVFLLLSPLPWVTHIMVKFYVSLKLKWRWLRMAYGKDKSILFEHAALITQIVALIIGIYFDFCADGAIKAVKDSDYTDCINRNGTVCVSYITHDSIHDTVSVADCSFGTRFLHWFRMNHEVNICPAGETASAANFTTALIDKDQAGIFLSILATIFTIHIALWALISGTLDKEYMGIAYPEYIFNMKPHVYKQKAVMISSFIFFVAAYFCYIFTLYNTVGAFLFCEIVSIAISTMFIYGIFRNQDDIKDDILSYSLEKHFETDK